MAKSPVFLERDVYRKRRLTDAIRLVPVMGGVLFMMPLLWPVSAGPDVGISTSNALRYLFGSWILLAMVAYLLWLRGRKTSSDTPPH